MMNSGLFESYNAVSTLLPVRDSSIQTMGRVVQSHNSAMILWLNGFCDYLPFEEAQDIVQSSLINLWLWCEKKEQLNCSEVDFIRLWKKFSKNNLLHWLRKKNLFCSIDSNVISSYTDENDSKQSEYHDLLNGFMYVLTEKERTLIEMIVDGFSSEDICITLGYKDKSVLKNLKSRAIRKMKLAAQQHTD